MKRIAIVADSNAGITAEDLIQYPDIKILSTPIIFGDEEFTEETNLTQELFYEKIKNEECSSSQPAIGKVKELWKKLLTTYDQILYIPISSGLSSTCDTGLMLQQEEQFKDRVYTVNNGRVSVTQRSACIKANRLAHEGLDAKEIHDILMKEKLDTSIYIAVDTMKYLKRGGRVSPTAAALGTTLHIKPVLRINDKKIDLARKTIGFKAARQMIISLIEDDLKNKFGIKDKNYDGFEFYTAYTFDKEKNDDFVKQVEEYFGVKVQVSRHLSCSVGVHIGPGAVALAIAKK